MFDAEVEERFKKQKSSGKPEGMVQDQQCVRSLLREPFPKLTDGVIQTLSSISSFDSGKKLYLLLGND